MDPESKEILQKTLELTEENNKMLLSIRRSMRTSRVMSYIYWFFIIGSAVGAFIFIQPYIDQLMGVYSGASDAIDKFKSATE